jgi:hypothetical protein
MTPLHSGRHWQEWRSTVVWRHWQFITPSNQKSSNSLPFWMKWPFWGTKWQYTKLEKYRSQEWWLTPLWHAWHEKYERVSWWKMSKWWYQSHYVFWLMCFGGGGSVSKAWRGSSSFHILTFLDGPCIRNGIPFLIQVWDDIPCISNFKCDKTKLFKTVWHHDF